VEPVRFDPAETINRIRQELTDGRDDDLWVQWGRWFLAEPATRTISPFSKITVHQYIEDRIAENTVPSLNEAKKLTFGNTDLSERIDQALSTLEQKTRAVLPKKQAGTFPAPTNLRRTP
jgi:hypothetical protein